MNFTLETVGSQQRKTWGFPGGAGKRFITQPTPAASCYHEGHSSSVHIDQYGAIGLGDNSADGNRQHNILSGLPGSRIPGTG